MLPFLLPVLFTFYIQSVLILKINSGAKGLIDALKNKLDLIHQRTNALNTIQFMATLQYMFRRRGAILRKIFRSKEYKPKTLNLDIASPSLK
jgi:hypothetical protein